MTEILFELVIYFPTFPNAMGHHLLHPLNGQPFASSRPYICASGDFTLFRVWPGYGLFPCFCKEAQNLSDVSGTPYELRSLNRVPWAYLMKPGFWIHQKIDRFSRI